MKQLFFFFFFLLTIVPGFAQVSVQDKPVVTILGTHHFANPGADMFNIHQDDVKAPGRQKEILELVDRLERFKPTKILIEGSYSSDYYLKRYARYLKHGQADSLARNESEQVGFRLARRGGHPTVYPFDYRTDMRMDSLMSFLEQDSTAKAKFDSMIEEMGVFIEGENKQLQESTMVEYLQYMNTKEAYELNYDAYMEMARMGGGDNFGGTETLISWWARNAKMFHYLTRHTDFSNPQERILIIVGQGHAKILKDLIEDANYYEYEHILPYLE